jgi:hypothetical protein
MKRLLMATAAVMALTSTGLVAAEKAAKDQSRISAGAELKGGGAGSAQTTGSGATMKSGADVRGGAEMKSGNGAKAGADVKGSAGARGKSETTGSSAQPNAKSGAKTDTKPGARSGAPSQGRDGASGRATTGQGAAGSAGVSVNLTQQQKTRIRTTVVQSSTAPKVERSKIKFSLNVGTVVPRTSVRLVTVPPTLAAIHPGWRGYLYFVVADEIVVVHPRTLAIVAIVAV